MEDLGYITQMAKLGKAVDTSDGSNNVTRQGNLGKNDLT
jgi:hypothetical protein